jgi:hypothetical protein
MSDSIVNKFSEEELNDILSPDLVSRKALIDAQETIKLQGEMLNAYESTIQELEAKVQRYEDAMWDAIARATQDSTITAPFREVLANHKKDGK